MSEILTFEPLARHHLPMMSRWLADPVVAEWYDEGGTSLEHLATQFGGVIEGTEATRGYIVHRNGAPIGYIQAVPIAGYPDYARQLAVAEGSVGIDIFLGEPDQRGRGVGSRMLRAFTDTVVFGEMRAPVAIIGPGPDNARAIRSYERAGFTWVKTVEVTDDEPWNTGTEYVMVRYPGQ